MKFDLVTEGWLPCLTLDGDIQELSLAEVFTRADRLVGLYDPSPIVTVSLYRLLLAVAHRVFGPSTNQEWGGVVGCREV